MKYRPPAWGSGHLYPEMTSSIIHHTKQISPQAGRQVGRQPGKQASNKQASRQPGKQANKPARQEQARQAVQIGADGARNGAFEQTQLCVQLGRNNEHRNDTQWRRGTAPTRMATWATHRIRTQNDSERSTKDGEPARIVPGLDETIRER